MNFAEQDTSIVPGAVRHTDNGVTWELVLLGRRVHILTGAHFWRVVVLDDDVNESLLITPHVFVTALKGYEWLMAWVDGDRFWDTDWGRLPDWPLMSGHEWREPMTTARLEEIRAIAADPLNTCEDPRDGLEALGTYALELLAEIIRLRRLQA